MERQPVRDPFHLSSSQIANNVLEWTIDVEFRQEQILIRPVHFLCFFIAVMPRLALDAGQLTALARIRI